MPFDPKLIQPDDAPLRGDGEIDLPADLAALGEQLRDDAQHLAARYPTGSELAANRPVPASARRPDRWKKVMVLAASGLAAALAVVVAVQLMNSPQSNPEVATVPVAPRNDPNEPTAEVSAAAAPVATVSLTELSGPELEALLDLWQREPARGEGKGVSF